MSFQPKYQRKVRRNTKVQANEMRTIKLTPGTPQNSVICPTGTPPPSITSICLQKVIKERVLPCFERMSFAVSCKEASADGTFVNDDSTALMMPKATSGVTLSSCDNSKGCIDCKSDTNRKPFLSSKSTVLLASGNVDTSLVLAMDCHTI